MDESTATAYLRQFLRKTLRIHTTDTRMFIGEFKCTDNECNVILSQAYEYRHPSQRQVKEAAERAAAKGLSAVKADMTSRFLGLIVVPGKHITRIEVEEGGGGSLPV